MRTHLKEVAIRIKAYVKLLNYLTFGRAGLRKVAQFIQQEEGAVHFIVPTGEAEAFVVWEEPNRANTPTLFIGGSGERYSTLTGVWWLDGRYFIVSHRSGLRLAIFDRLNPADALCKAEVAHLADDVAAKRVDEHEWEVALSGCWECIHSRHQVTRQDAAEPTFEIKPLDTEQHAGKDFCHGVGYGDAGALCYTIHTGKRPRLSIGQWTSQLPTPWGARDVCYDSVSHRYVAVAVSVNPQRFAYSCVQTSLWVCEQGSREWRCLAVYVKMHSDAVDVWGGCIWMPDQLGNRLLCLEAATGVIRGIASGDAFNFPHGLGISSEGKIAVTNYGTSSVVILDGANLLKSFG